jgi:uncharacterized protein (DUF1501 family)
MKLTRRDLLAAGATSAALHSIQSPSRLAAASLPEDRILVVIQLKGGNDWLNTLVPATSSVYQAARSSIRIQPTQGLPVGTSAHNGALFLHPAMTGMKRLWDAGKLALVSGVGYPGQSLSHFQSEDVWYSASPARSLSGGWLGRYFRSFYTGGYDLPAVLAQSEANGSFASFSTPSLNDPQLLNIRLDPASAAVDGRLEQTLIVNNVYALRPTANPSLAHARSVLEGVVASAARFTITGANYVARATYPAATNPLVMPLKLIARYITGGSTTIGSGLDTRCYYFTTPTGNVMANGFDSHASQGGATGQHANLLREVSDAVEAFIQDLAAWGHGQRVVVMLWTEFSRRIGENGSGGTDHGDAGGVILAGDPIVGGHYGVYPDLSRVTPPYNQQVMTPTTDFRDVYSTILQRWWATNPTNVIPGWTPTMLDFLP